MNPVEIEESVSNLAAEPFDRAKFPFSFLLALGGLGYDLQLAQMAHFPLLRWGSVPVTQGCCCLKLANSYRKRRLKCLILRDISVDAGEV